MLYWILKILFSPFFKLIWIKKVEGLQNIPKNGAFIIAANHSSYFDFFSLVVICPRKITFLAAEKFYTSKFWYPLVAGTRQIKVERESSDKEEVYKKVDIILKNNQILGIFPEGTRSPSGKIEKTYTGVAKFAIDAKVPVIPVGITGTYEVLSRHEKWPKFKKIININIGKQMHFESYYGKSNDKLILRDITDKIVKEIENLKK